MRAEVDDIIDRLHLLNAYRPLDVAPVFDSSRESTHWAKRKLAQDR
jgi:hypothetical protein